MAAVTMNTAELRSGVQFLESISVLNGDGMGADTKLRGLAVPAWATKAVFTIFYDAGTGTSPLFDFALGTPDWGSTTLIAAPTDATDQAGSLGNAAWNGITQVTGAGPYVITIEVGPDVTDDDTGSASASCYYGVKGELPPVLQYLITIDTTTNDEDYTIRLAVMWR